MLVAACAVESPSAPDSELATTTQDLGVSGITREHVTGDVYHYGFVLRVGDGPNALLHLHRVVRERAPWQPRATTGAIMMMHGDFATFSSNFVPSAGGIAPWLAARNIDVWGLDRRFTQAPDGDDADVSDFDAMGITQELDDIGTALGFARATRLVTDHSTDRLNLVGFSRGGELAYFYASREATRPAALRHVKGIVPLDVYVSVSPADEDLRQFFCTSAFFEYQDLAAGVVDSPNSFQIEVGQLAQSDPDGQTPFQGFFPGFTNREVMLTFMGQTYQLFSPSPLYHLLGPILDGDMATGLRFSAEAVANNWLATAPPHSSLREAADTDALTCGDSPPVELPLSRIHVPLLLIAAAGGYGEHALYSTTQVGSTDVSTMLVRQLPVGREAEDFGHGDLLYAPAAAGLAWQPLLSWLRAH
ncbi:MAG TPA: hypothetical protein VGO00_02505 [Kofleriaceae bacterium]|nr:hypothetical protein [Kofleriaceae bacterium]